MSGHDQPAVQKKVIKRWVRLVGREGGEQVAVALSLALLAISIVVLVTLRASSIAATARSSAAIVAADWYR